MSVPQVRGKKGNQSCEDRILLKKRVLRGSEKDRH